MNWIQTFSTATTPIDSWDGMDIWISEDRWNNYLAVEGTVYFRATVEQGIDQGWIVLIDPNLPQGEGQ